MGFRFHLADRISCTPTPMMIGVGSDDRTAVTVCDDKLIRVDLLDRTQVELCRLPDQVSDLAVNVDHRLVAVAAGSAEVAIHRLDDGVHVQSMSREGTPGSLSTVPANHIAMGPGGKMLVTTTSGSRIFVSNIDTGQWEHVMFVKYDGCDAAVSPDGKYVALFGAAKASEISGHLTMFLVRRGLQPLWTRWHESDKAVTSCRFAPDSQSVITCGAGDGARVWKTASGELQWHVQAKENNRQRTAWSFGEKEMLAALGDQLMMVRKGNNAPVFRVDLPASESVFAISQSGRLLLRADEKDTLSIWKLDDSK